MWWIYFAGHYFLMSLSKYGKKVLNSQTIHRTCGFCKWHKRKFPDKKVPQHRCVWNHRGSAKMMEITGCTAAIKAMKKNGTPVEILEGDGDDTVIPRLAQENIIVDKRYDKNHIVKNFGSRCYDARKECSSLSLKIIKHLQKCLTYCFSNNKGDLKGMEENLAAIVPHQFGDHTVCKPHFCGAERKKGKNYSHQSLPYKKTPLMPCLEEEAGRYLPPIHCSRSPIHQYGQFSQAYPSWGISSTWLFNQSHVCVHQSRKSIHSWGV